LTVTFLSFNGAANGVSKTEADPHFPGKCGETHHCRALARTVCATV